jgi:hypothetical protein
MANRALAAEVAKDLFGANLADQGRGFYVALELFALLRGSLDEQGQVLPHPDRGPLRLRLRSHDFARRLAGTDVPPPEEAIDKAFDQETRQVVSSLVESLTVPVPGRIKAATFKQRALYPYVGELIHYDAVDRRGRILIERYTSRGAGGLAHRILRDDPDPARHARVQEAAARLVSDSGSSLGRLMNTLATHDAAPPREAWTDEEEAQADTKEAVDKRWCEHLRDGVDRILRSDLAAARRVERLMHWIPYCIARHQAFLAARELAEPSADVPVDLRDRASPLRSQARAVFDRQVVLVGEALSRRAERMAELSQPGERRDELMLLARSGAWKTWTGFHSQTLAACGAINAPKGQRHFTAKLPFLEAMVGATVDPDGALPFGEFCGTLYRRYQLVVDKTAADAAGLLDTIDAHEFEANERALIARLRDLGLLTEYSDQTRLVRAVAT